MPRRLYGEDSENDDEGNNNEFPRTPTRDHQHGEGNGEGEQPEKSSARQPVAPRIHRASPVQAGEPA